MIPCPACKSVNVRGRRGPKLVGKAVFRRHRCQDCRHEFMSCQLVIEEGEIAEFVEGLSEKTAA